MHVLFLIYSSSVSYRRKELCARLLFGLKKNDDKYKLDEPSYWQESISLSFFFFVIRINKH